MISKRDDDAFLRRVIWLLLTLSISSAGGWIWTIAVIQSRVDYNSEAVKEIKELQQTMTSIDKGVSVLVANARVRNGLLQKMSVKQSHIFGEQQRRKPLVDWVERRMGK